MSEHRGHLLPDTEDISCRGGPIVELRPGMRQRIYRCRDRDVLAGHARLPSGTLRVGGAGPPLRERLLECRPAEPWRQVEGGGVQVGHGGVERGPRSCQGDGGLRPVRRHRSLFSSSLFLYLAAAVSGAGGRPRCSRSPYQGRHRRDRQGEQQRHGGCHDQRERELADRRPRRVTLISWDLVRAPRVRDTTRSVMPNALNHKAARRPPPWVSLRATSGAAIPAAMSPGPAGSANSAGRRPRPW